jgi:5-formyltetrahydrofolate cyclo-ligase
MKKTLRQQALAYRSQITAHEFALYSKQISQLANTLLQSFGPCTVGLFYPISGEPDLLSIVNRNDLEGFAWALPVCCSDATGKYLKFARYSSETQLKPGSYNIPVPSVQDWLVPQVVFMPCLGFDRSGARLGYGAGWYDQTMARLSRKPVMVGIAYAATEFAQSFAQPHDQLMDWVLTEKEVIQITSRRINQ